MADKRRSAVSVQPSLQELCESQGLEQILRSDNADSEFASLEPRLQQLLFSRLRTENARLREVERRWRLLTMCCPHLDTQIHLSSTRIEPGGGEDEQNGFNQQTVFLRQWSYLVEDAYDSENGDGEYTGSRTGNSIRDLDSVEANEGEGSIPELVRDTKWDCSNLISQSPDSELRLCFHHNDVLTRCSCRPKGYGRFSHRVSSQLLLYRLTVTFGMPPPQEVDGYKSCWEADLQYHDGASLLSFQDYKGAADARFHGTAEASVDALKLLNFLIGLNCPHTYDGIVAGRRA